MVVRMEGVWYEQAANVIPEEQDTSRNDTAVE